MVATVLNWHADFIDAPAMDHFAVVTSDTINFTTPFRSVYVGVAGDVVIVSANSTVVTYKNATAGSVLPVAGIRINATNTTATSLVGLV